MRNLQATVHSIFAAAALGFAAALCLLYTPQLWAQEARPLTLQPGSAARDLTPYVHYGMSPLSPDTAAADVLHGGAVDFRPIPHAQIDFGFVDDTVWLLLPLHNGGVQTASWLLALNTRFMNEMVVSLNRGSNSERLLDNSERSVFSARPIPYRMLTVAFQLEAGETADLLIGYRSRGTTFLPLTIETEQSFSDQRSLANTKSGGFYTAAALMFAVSLFQLLLPRNRIHLHYLLYLSAATLYVFHMDGLSFQFLWPNHPQWNAFASLPCGLLITFLAANFSRQFLDTRHTAVMFDRLILLTMVLCVLTVVWAALVEDRHSKQFSFWLTTIATLIYLAAGVNALRQGRRSARFYVVGWAGIFSAAAFASIIHTVDANLPVSLSFDLTKAGILFDALMFSMAMADRANLLRRQRDLAIQGELDALRLAEQQSDRLATASHDIRQPLSAMKMALQAQQNGPTEASPAMNQSIAYLESLVGGYLEQSEQAHHQGEPAAGVAAHRESFPIQLILDNAAQMFRAEAEAKQLCLRVEDSSAIVSGDPVATIRIASNLLSNAIHYTGQGSVLIGCRPRGERLELWVCDTGPGIAADEQLRLMEKFYRSDTSEGTDGHGLGLNIVATLCAEQGYMFTLASVMGAGTTFRVSMPRLGTG